MDEIFDKQAAAQMGIDRVGQVCVMIHSGSRGLGHQVATDALVAMEAAMSRDKIDTNDRQLSCARIQSQEGQDYLAAMSAAANYAWVGSRALHRSPRPHLSAQPIHGLRVSCRPTCSSARFCGKPVSAAVTNVTMRLN